MREHAGTFAPRHVDMQLARRTARALFVLALSVYVATAGGSLTTSDAVVAFDVARNIVTRGSVAQTGNLMGSEAVHGVDGRYYSPFGLAQSIYDIPFYLAGRAVTRVTGLQPGKPDTVEKAAVVMGQTLLGAAIVWQVFMLGARVTGSSVAAALSALTIAFASVLWPYAQFGFSQPLATATLLAVVRHAWLGVADRSDGHLRWAAVWFVVAQFSRHEVALAAIPLLAWIGWAGGGTTRDRIARMWAFLPGVLAGLGAWLAFNWWRFGNPLDSGHLNDPVMRFGSSIITGLAGLLFTPLASVFLYSPFVIFGVVGLVRLWRDDRTSAALFGGLTLVFLLFYASLGNWYGGRAYGSRYLVITLPWLAMGWTSMLAAMEAGSARRLFLAVFVVGFTLQWPGVLLDYAKVGQAAAATDGAPSAQDEPWSWALAPVVVNARALPAAVSDNIAYVTGRQTHPVISAPADDADRDFSQQFAFSLDLWWLYLFYLGALPRAVLVVLVLALAVCAVGAAMQVRKSMQPLAW